jgi:hypothetical protein
MPIDGALHQKPGKPGRTEKGRGEAASATVSDEATLARHAQTDWGAGDLLGQALAREKAQILLTSTTRTARCGPARRVVWEGSGLQ